MIIYFTQGDAEGLRCLTPKSVRPLVTGSHVDSLVIATPPKPNWIEFLETRLYAINDKMSIFSGNCNSMMIYRGGG